MTPSPVPSPRPTTSRLHPLAFKAMTVLAIWFAASAWGFFAGGYTGLIFAVVSWLVGIVIVIAFVMRRIWRGHPIHGREGEPAEPFSDWAEADFESAGSRITSLEALGEALLPIAVVAFGLTAFAIVWNLVS